MRTFSQDLRERIIAARKAGHSAQEIALLFQVSKRTVERFWSKYQKTGAVLSKPRGGYRRSQLEKHDGMLRRWIAENKGITLAELQSRIVQVLGIKLGTTALWHRLEHLGLSYKKNAARRRAKPSGPPGRPPKLAKVPKKLGGSKAGLYR